MCSSSWSARGWRRGSWRHEADPRGRPRVRSTIAPLSRRVVLRPRLSRHPDPPLWRDLQLVRHSQGAARRSGLGFHLCIPWLRSSVEQYDNHYVPGDPDERELPGLHAGALDQRGPPDSRRVSGGAHPGRDGKRERQGERDPRGRSDAVLLRDRVFGGRRGRNGVQSEDRERHGSGIRRRIPVHGPPIRLHRLLPSRDHRLHGPHDAAVRDDVDLRGVPNAEILQAPRDDETEQGGVACCEGRFLRPLAVPLRGDHDARRSRRVRDAGHTDAARRSPYYRGHLRIHRTRDGPRNLRAGPGDGGGPGERDRIPDDVPGGLLLPDRRDASVPPDAGPRLAAHVHQRRLARDDGLRERRDGAHVPGHHAGIRGRLFRRRGARPLVEVEVTSPALRTPQMNSANFATSSGRVSFRTFRIARTLSFVTPTWARTWMMSSNSRSDNVTSLFFASQLRYRFSSSFARQPRSYSMRAASPKSPVSLHLERTFPTIMPASMPFPIPPPVIGSLIRAASPTRAMPLATAFLIGGALETPPVTMSSGCACAIRGSCSIQRSK